MKKDVIYIIIIFLLLAVLITTNFNRLTGFAAFSETNEKTNFSVYTAAVCTNNTNNLSCRDEIFIRCKDIEYQIPTNVSLTHESDWKDPREKEENV